MEAFIPFFLYDKIKSGKLHLILSFLGKIFQNVMFSKISQNSEIDNLLFIIKPT